MKKNAIYILLAALSTPAMANTVTDQAKGAGFTQCLETTETLANFLVGENAHASHDFWNSDNVNERFFNSLIVKDYSDGDSHISLTIVPRGNKCDWSSTETFTVEQPCQVVREEMFSEMSYGGSMNKTSLMLHKDNDLYYYLTPSESSKACLVTKREIFYQS